MKYRSRISRKRFVLNTSSKVKYYTKKTINLIESFIDGFDTLDTVIYKHIKEGLDFGYSPRYYVTNNLYHYSIEAEYKEYHKEPASFEVYNRLFNTLALQLIPYRFSKYKDIEIVRDEDEYGRYFEVRIID